MRSVKLLFTILCVGLLSGVILSGCSDSVTQTSSDDTTRTFDVGTVDKSLGSSYVRGLPFVSTTANDYANGNSLTNDYNTWKNTYVTSSGAGYNALRVTTDKAHGYITCSEGMGYGMLLAVYFNDQTTFDQLYNFVKAHFIQINGTTVNLMQWKQDSNGVNVSEYSDYNIDTAKFYYNGQTLTSQTAAIPHGAVFGNVTSGSVFITSQGSEGSKLVIALDNHPNYYRMFKQGNDRTYSSATDADEDIAAALCFAVKVWPNGSTTGVDYTNEARYMVKAIEAYDFNSSGFIKAGNAWGDNKGWNPSYFTPAYYLNVYAQICPDDYAFWQLAYTTMYTEMYKIADYVRSKSSTVFFPDWCDTSVSGAVSKSTASDRLYYNFGKQTDTTTQIGMHCPLSAMWFKGTSKYQYNAHLMSFNSYYDAVRVPWRIATDYAWDTTSGNTFNKYSGRLMTYLNNAYVGKWQSSPKHPPQNGGFVDGYTITGAPWAFADRDGFNVNTKDTAGGQWCTTEFVSMGSTVGLYAKNSTPDYSDPNGFWSAVQKSYTTDSWYNYYGNSLRMLSMVFLTGKLQNLYALTSPPTTPVPLYRYVNGWAHYYTTNFAELGNGINGWSLEGVQCNVYSTAPIGNGTVPLYAYYNGADWYYTTSWSELNGAAGLYGYTLQGIAANVYTRAGGSSLPLYRYYSITGYHFFTTNWNELGGGNSYWTYEGIQCYVK